MAPELLVQCIRRVHVGGTWLARALAGRALERLAGRARGDSSSLTARELVLAGLRNKEIAQRLGIGEGTVKIHLHNVYEKLGVDSRLALAARAREKGLA